MIYINIKRYFELFINLAYNISNLFFMIFYHFYCINNYLKLIKHYITMKK